MVPGMLVPFVLSKFGPHQDALARVGTASKLKSAGVAELLQVTPDLNSRNRILFQMLFIIVGQVTPHELKMLHVTSHVVHHCGTSYPT